MYSIENDLASSSLLSYGSHTVRLSEDFCADLSFCQKLNP